MFAIILTALFIVAAVWGIDQIKQLKKRPVALGALFGLLAVIAHVLRLEYHNPELFVSLIDVPIMAAGLFFGPVPGLVAGGIAVLVRSTTQLWVGTGYWISACWATALIAVYGAGVGRYYFYGKRPALLPAAFVMAFGEFLRLLVLFVGTTPYYSSGMADLFVTAYPPAFVGAAIAGAGCAIVFRSWGNLRDNLLNYTMLEIQYYGSDAELDGADPASDPQLAVN